jgi:hypothetical protein
MPAPDAVDPPAIPERRLLDSGWAKKEEVVETVASVAGITVRAHTAIYDDIDLRRRVIESGGTDRVWRFFFASRMVFTPSLSASIIRFAKPRVFREAREGFADELRERGFEGVTIGETTGMRIDSDTTGKLTTYEAVFEAEDRTVPIAGRAATWYDGTFYVAGGAYPTENLDVGLPTEKYDEELLSLTRSVGETEQR